MLNRIFAKTKINTMSTIQNIFAFIGTYLTISTGIMLFLQSIVYLITKKLENKERINSAIIIIGILIASLLIPFYYLPA